MAFVKHLMERTKTAISEGLINYFFQKASYSALALFWIFD
jgi:hypothetical protein